jgi:FKBP-type peptidyl-prolyl cis-trans isomerase 2
MNLHKFRSATIVALVFFLSSIALGDAIAEDSTVTTEFTMSLQDGTVVATTEGKEPVTFTMGEDKMMASVQNQMVGLEEGESKEFTLQPAQAFGPADPEAIKSVPTEKIPEDHRKVGEVLTFNRPEDRPLQARIVAVGETETKVDFNHPLAGKTVVVKVKVVKVE